MRWTKISRFWCFGASLYFLVLVFVAYSLYSVSREGQPPQPETFEIIPQPEKTTLTLHYDDLGPVPEAGVLLPLGPDSHKLPGLPVVWKELARLQGQGVFNHQKSGFDGLQAVVSLRELAESAAFDVPLSHAVEQVYRLETFLILLTSQGDLLLLDIKQPSTPHIVATIEFDLPIKSLFVHDNMAYCLLASARGGEAQLVIMDISEPSSPREIIRHGLPVWSHRLSWSGSCLFVVIKNPAFDHKSIHLYELVGNQMNPLGKVDEIDLGQTFVCHQDVWFVAEAGHGMLIFDFSDPSSPYEVARLELPEPLRYLTVSGNRLFAWGGSKRIYVVDVSNPLSPRVLHVEEGATVPVQLVFVGQHTYYLDRKGGLKVFPYGPLYASTAVSRRNEKIYQGVVFEDAHRAGLLQLTAKGDSSSRLSDEIIHQVVYPGADQVVAKAWWQERLLVLSLKGRLSLLDLNQEAVEVLSELMLPEACHWIVVAHGHVYLGSHDRMYVVSVHGNRLQVSGQQALDGFDKIYEGVEFFDGLLLTAGRSGLMRFSLEEPLRPKIISTWQIPSQIKPLFDAQQLVVYGNRVFVAAGKAGLLTGVIDARGQLVFSGDLQFKSPAKTVEVHDGLAMVATRHAVQVVDVHDVNHLQHVGSIEFTGVVEMVVSDKGYWAGRVDHQSWTCLPVPKIFLMDDRETEFGNDFRFVLPAMPDMTSYRINLFNEWGRTSLPGTYDVKPPAKFPKKQSDDHV